MYQIAIKPELASELAEYAKRRGLTIDALFGEALERIIEDIDDIAAVEEALRDYDPAHNISHEQLRRDLGLDP